MKDLVYREKPRTIQELKAQITAKFEEIDIELCRRVCRSVPARLQLCIDHEGGHFENYNKTAWYSSVIIFSSING